jgi:hypothetical protein
MHLGSQRPSWVQRPPLQRSTVFEAGEGLRTEVSYTFRPRQGEDFTPSRAFQPRSAALPAAARIPANRHGNRLRPSARPRQSRRHQHSDHDGASDVHNGGEQLGESHCFHSFWFGAWAPGKAAQRE